jgi:hypothetical protein
MAGPGTTLRTRALARIQPALGLGLALAAVPLFLWKLTFTNLILARGDVLLYQYPHWEHRAQALRTATVPLWNQFLFMGVPFLANPQTAVLYPPNWLIIGFNTPTAYKVSFIAHLLLASAGTYWLARRTLQLDATGAAVAALLFALGGSLLGKAEQINQLQSLAWMPWVLHLAFATAFLRASKRTGLLLCLVVALQVIAGHPQTVFITLVGAAIWIASAALATKRAASLPAPKSPPAVAAAVRRAAVALLRCAPFLCGAAMLAGAQLVPALELSGESLRSAGLGMRESLSFSLSPLVLGRALLPNFTRALFTEYVAYVGCTGLLLIAAGLAAPARRPAARRALLASAALAASGLLLALGGFNPLYWLLVRLVPGLTLFRAPVRWLALWALGGALLAGTGIGNLAQLTRSQIKRASWCAGAAIAGLVMGTIAGASHTPAGETGPLGMPLPSELAAWLLAAALGLAIFASDSARLAHFRKPALIALLVLELFLASAPLPVNNPTTPDAYNSMRPAVLEILRAQSASLPAARMLSLSELTYDPGDLTEMRSMLAPDITSTALVDAITAAKSKELLSPNLPLAWNIPTLDGYDGGLLPTRSYAQFAAQLADPAIDVPDGRLRERLKALPPAWLLNITNTRWLITDKSNDVWLDGIYFDRQFARQILNAPNTALPVTPPFLADGLALILETVIATEPTLVMARITPEAGAAFELAVPESLQRAGTGTLKFATLAAVAKVELYASKGSAILRSATLVHTPSRTFKPLAALPYRVAHSGDVKVYENLDAWPRAYLVYALPVTELSQPAGSAAVTLYSAQRIDVQTSATTTAHLVLADANYPGWHATVDGAAAPIETANGLLRTVNLSPGAHSVSFIYAPDSWRYGLMLSVAGALLWCAAWLIKWPAANRAA